MKKKIKDKGKLKRIFDPEAHCDNCIHKMPGPMLRWCERIFLRPKNNICGYYDKLDISKKIKMIKPIHPPPPPRPVLRPKAQRPPIKTKK